MIVQPRELSRSLIIQFITEQFLTVNKHSLRKLLILLAFVGFFISGCQYQFGHGELSNKYQSISVPYVIGDKEGDLTAEIIKRIEKSGAFRYTSSGGDLILYVKVKDYSNEDVGYRYDRKKHGKLKKAIIPAETRLNIFAEVSLKDAATGEILRGPSTLTASIDFDHDFYFTRHEINVFSLGQLNDIDAAEDAVIKPLNRNLAERIVAYVTNSW